MAIAKRKNKNKIVYEAEVWNEGRIVARKRFPSKRLAENWHDRESLKYRDPYYRSNPYEKLSLREVFNKYLAERVPELRESTQQTQTNRHWCVLNSPLIDLRMYEIDGFAIDRWIEWLKKHPTARSKRRKSFRQELNCLRAIMFWYRDYYNERFVVPIVKRHTKAVFFKQTAPRRPDYYIKPEEARNWLKWLQRRENRVYFRLATFLIQTGCRIGEAAGLFWFFSYECGLKT